MTARDAAPTPEGCCSLCGGTGVDLEGPCPECYATGLTHPEPLSAPTPEGVRLGAEEREAYEVTHDSSGRPSSKRDGACTCDYNPETTDGPREDCPFHGRSYGEWVDRGDVVTLRLAAERAAHEALRARVEALAAEHERTVSPAPYTSERALIERLRAALDAPEVRS